MHSPPLRRPVAAGREPGTILLEAIVAAGFAATALAIIAPMFANQLQMARRARDLELIDVMVSKDIAAFRHYARHWNHLSKGPYSTAYNNQSGAAANFGQLIYQSVTNDCQSWTTTNLGSNLQLGIGGKMENSFGSDLGSYTGSSYFPAGKNLVLQASNGFLLDVPGYKVLRRVSAPSVVTIDTRYNNYTSSSSDPLTVRLTYTVQRTTGAEDPNMPFERTADIQVSAQFWC